MLLNEKIENGFLGFPSIMPSFSPSLPLILVLCLDILVNPTSSQPLSLQSADSGIENGISSEADNNKLVDDQTFREENGNVGSSYGGNHISEEVPSNVGEVSIDSQGDNRAIYTNSSNLVQNGYRTMLNADRNNMYPVAYNTSGPGATYNGAKLQQDYPSYENQALTMASNYGILSGGKVQSHPNLQEPLSYQLYSNTNSKTASVKPHYLPMNPYDPNSNVGANMIPTGLNPSYKQVQSNPAMNYNGPERIFQQPVSSAGAMMSPQNAYIQLGNSSGKALTGERGFQKQMSAELRTDTSNDALLMSAQNLQERQLESGEQAELAGRVNRPERGQILPVSLYTKDDGLMKAPLKSNPRVSSLGTAPRPRREMTDTKWKTFSVDDNSLTRGSQREQNYKGRTLEEILDSASKDFDVNKVGKINSEIKVLKREVASTLLDKKSADSNIIDWKPIERRDTKLQIASESQKAGFDLGGREPIVETGLVFGAPNRLRRGSSPCLCTSKISVNAVVPCSTPGKSTTSKVTQGKQHAGVCTTRCVLNVLVPCKSNMRKNVAAQAETPEKKIFGLVDDRSESASISPGGREDAGAEDKGKS